MIGDALAVAKVCVSRRVRSVSPFRNSFNGSYSGRGSPASEKERFLTRSQSFGSQRVQMFSNSKSRDISGVTNYPSELTSQGFLGSQRHQLKSNSKLRGISGVTNYASELTPHGPVQGQKKMFLSPAVPYQPTQGLVAFFARTGTSSGNTRAPHCYTRTHAAFSYIDVVRRAMEGCGANGQRGGGSYRGAANGRGLGQGGMIGRGGFQATRQAFNPGYGGRGQYNEGGGGRFNGGHGRYGGHFAGRGTGYGGRRGRGPYGYGGGAQLNAPAAEEIRPNQSQPLAVEPVVPAAASGGAAAATTNGAMLTPENALALLQQAFATVPGVQTLLNAMQNNVAQLPKASGNTTVGAGSSKLEPIPVLTEATTHDEAPEPSAKVPKENNGKPPYCYRC